MVRDTLSYRATKGKGPLMCNPLLERVGVYLLLTDYAFL
jgi:hypothetical protein